MKSFPFSKPSSNKNIFYQDLLGFLNYAENYYMSQMEQVSKKVAYSEKIQNRVLSNFKDKPDFKRLASKPDPTANKSGKVNASSGEDQIQSKIEEAETVLKQVEEEQKPKKIGVTSLKIPKSDEQKTQESSRFGQKKVEPNKDVIKNKSSALSTKGKLPLGKIDNLATQKKKTEPSSKTGGSNWMKHVPNRNQEEASRNQTKITSVSSTNEIKDKEEKKEDTNVNNEPVRRIQSILEKEKEEDTVDKEEIKPKIHRFQIQETELVNKEHIIEFLEAKKGVKKKLHELKENINYYKEKEKKTKLRFMSKLTSHLESVQDIVTRQYYESNNRREEENDVERIQFSSLNLDDKAFPLENSQIGKILRISQYLLDQLKSSMDLSNEEFKNIIDCQTVFQESEDNLDPFDKIVKLFRSWYLMDSINAKIVFLKKDLVGCLERPEIENIMYASESLWKVMNYFIPVPVREEQQNENNMIQISWLNCLVKNEESPEIVCSKSVLKGSKKMFKEFAPGENILKLEYINMKTSVLKVIVYYLLNKYSLNQQAKSIRNTNGPNLADFLQMLRLLSIFTKGNCRRFPLFMIEAEN